MPAKAEPGGASGASRGGDAAAQRPAEPEGAITLEQRAAEWGEYLRKHDIERLVEAALAQVIADRPARPLEALATLVEAGIPPATRPAPPKGERAEALAFLREHALEQALQRALNAALAALAPRPFATIARELRAGAGGAPGAAPADHGRIPLSHTAFSWRGGAAHAAPLSHTAFSWGSALATGESGAGDSPEARLAERMEHQAPRVPPVPPAPGRAAV